MIFSRRSCIKLVVAKLGDFAMNFFRHVCMGTLVGCVVLGGCQTARQQTARNPMPRETAPTLNVNQQADLQVAFARSLEKSGAGDQAKSAYEDALKKDPQRADAIDRLAVMHARKGQFEQAIELHKKALVLQPRNADFVCNLGYSYYLQQRWAEAEIQLRKAIELTPGHGRALNNLGLVLARTVRTNEALAAFRRSGCTEADAHSNVAFALTLEHSFKDAHEHFARARALDPTSELAEDGLRVVNAQLGGRNKVINAAVGSPKVAVLASPLATPAPAPANNAQVVLPEPARLPAPVRINGGLEPPISTISDSPSESIKQVSGMTPSRELAPSSVEWVTIEPVPGDTRDSKMEPSNR